MCQRLGTKDQRISYKTIEELEDKGSAVIFTHLLEVVELKQQQVIIMGRDHSVNGSTGPLETEIIKIARIKRTDIQRTEDDEIEDYGEDFTEEHDGSI